MTSARDFQTKTRRKFNSMARGMAGRPVMISMAPAFTMLLNSEFGEAAMQLLRVLYASAKGNGERQECFVCLEPWAPDRAPVVVGAAELIQKEGQPAGAALMFAICDRCVDDQRAITAAFERDFGKFKLIGPESGTA
jgi:hypothetical protein